MNMILTLQDLSVCATSIGPRGSLRLRVSPHERMLRYRCIRITMSEKLHWSQLNLIYGNSHSHFAFFTRLLTITLFSAIRLNRGNKCHGHYLWIRKQWRFFLHIFFMIVTRKRLNVINFGNKCAFDEYTLWSTVTDKIAICNFRRRKKKYTRWFIFNLTIWLVLM